MREVDDAVRRSDAENFLQRYGWWVLGGIVLLLAAFGGYIVWQNQAAAARGREGEAFVKAIDGARADRKAADAAFGAIAAEGKPGYEEAALMMQAALKLDANDPKAAAALYGRVAADDGAPAPLRNLALVRQTAAEFDSLPPQTAIDRLKPLAQPGNPWFPSAGEMTAVAWLKLGKRDLAGPLFAQIAKEPGVPDAVKSRARQMAGVLGIDAVEEKDTVEATTAG